MEHGMEGRRKRGLPDKAKARLMMEEGSIKGHPMTTKQRGLFGTIASGKKPTRMKRRKRGGY